VVALAQTNPVPLVNQPLVPTQVKDPIAPKICRRYSDGGRYRRIVHLRLKGAIAVTQKYRNRAAAVVGNRQIEIPVPVEITDRDGTW